MQKIKQKNKIKFYLKTIDQIEKTRNKNNFNWMNILRIAIKNSPAETIKIMKNINIADKKILKLNEKFHKKK